MKKTKRKIVATGAIKAVLDGELTGSKELFVDLLADFDKSDTTETAPSPAKTFIKKEISVPTTIFRAYDIRGMVGESLSTSVVNKIGQAIGSEASELGQQSVVVANDGRLSSPDLVKALINGLRAAGCDVIYIGMVPTPVLYFSTYYLGTNAGIMLTGSHNGPEYNGLKIVLDNQALSGNAIQSIYNRIISGRISDGKGKLKTIDVGNDYLGRITKEIVPVLNNPCKIVVDCGNGVAGHLAPKLYQSMGYEVLELFCDIDGNFPNHHPDPSQPENLQALIKAVKNNNADLGFAFDGDGDRLGVIDNKGNIIWPDRQMMLFAKDVLSRNKGATIVFDVKCSRHLKTVIEANGGRALMWKTGHSLIKSKMKTVDAPLAGEMSGHIFFKERWYGFDDALYAGARLLEILSKYKKSASDIFAELPGGLTTPELRIPLAERYHAQVMQEIKTAMTFETSRISEIDGLRVDFEDGWGLLRPSNTSPFLVARFEAENQLALDRIQKDFHNLLQASSVDIKSPF